MAEIKGRLYARASVAKIPLTGAFELTPLCNFQCKMCYIRKTPAEVKELGGLLPLDFWLDVARQACEAGTLSPLITGGEPFTYPHIRELYQAMCKMGMEVSFNSNGSCITEEVVSWLRETPPVRINITLYGGSNETYGRLCGDPHGFDKMRRGVELLRKNNIRFKFNCSLTPDNVADHKAMIDFAKSYDKPIRMATYMFPPLRRIGDGSGFTDRLTAEQCAYYQVLTDWYQLEPEQFRKTALNAVRYRELTPELMAEAEAKGPRPMGCLAGRCGFWVDWQGNLSGCGMMDFPRFSLKEMSFEKAWRGVVDWTNELRYCPTCTNCVNHSVCFVCTAMVYNETGGLEERPQYLCDKAKYCAMYYKEFLNKLPEDLRSAAGNPADTPPETCAFDDDLMP